MNFGAQFNLINKKKAINVTANLVFFCVNNIHYQPLIDKHYLPTEMEYPICNILREISIFSTLYFFHNLSTNKIQMS